MSIRLINTGTLQMKLFNSATAPRYAILSHTWVEDEEISFQEMSQIADNPDHEATRKSGFAKIVATCRKARTYDIQYAWVDTCCIDKTSSAELSEAINTMFRWYRESKICFAYLADLPVNAKDVDVSMRNCRWFTRGWCLQELIAPKNLFFYDEEWKYRGSKSGLKRSIAAITNVDEEVLQYCNLMYSSPVARRMSWASRRITTRVEDIAYCLLGIFDVNMPMLYGEGEKAFSRLQEEIIRRSSDMSIFCFSPSPIQPSIYNPQGLETPDTLSKMQFCGMFAKSPAEFADCGTIRHKSGSRVGFDAQAFSVSNRGIQLGEQKLYRTPSTGIQCFGLEVDYKLSELHEDDCRSTDIFLRKVGRNIFARMPVDLQLSRILKRRTVLEDVCVLPHVAPLVHNQIHQALERVIRIRVHEQDGWWAGFSHQIPRESWDESAVQFLVPDSAAFSAYLRMGITTGGLTPDRDIYLGCNTGNELYYGKPLVALGICDSKEQNSVLWSSGAWISLVDGLSPSTFHLALGSQLFSAQISRDGGEDSDSEIYTCVVTASRVADKRANPGKKPSVQGFKE